MGIKVVGSKSTVLLDHPLAKPNYPAEALWHALDQF